MVPWASIGTLISGPTNAPGGPKLREVTGSMWAKTTLNLYPAGSRQSCEVEQFVWCALSSLLMTMTFPFLWCCLLVSSHPQLKTFLVHSFLQASVRNPLQMSPNLQHPPVVVFFLDTTKHSDPQNTPGHPWHPIHLEGYRTRNTACQPGSARHSSSKESFQQGIRSSTVYIIGKRRIFK